MNISQVPAALVGVETKSALSIAVAKKALAAMKVDGAAAIEMIQQAARVQENGLGGRTDMRA